MLKCYLTLLYEYLLKKNLHEVIKHKDNIIL